MSPIISLAERARSAAAGPAEDPIVREVVNFCNGAVTSAQLTKKYRPDDLKDFPLPEMSGLIPDARVLIYIEVISGYGPSPQP